MTRGELLHVHALLGHLPNVDLGLLKVRAQGFNGVNGANASHSMY